MEGIKFEKVALKKIEGMNLDYMIYVISVKGNINVVLKLVVYKGGWRLIGEICKCILSCIWLGCEVIGMCLCI